MSEVSEFLIWTKYYQIMPGPNYPEPATEEYLNGNACYSMAYPEYFWVFGRLDFQLDPYPPEKHPQQHEYPGNYEERGDHIIYPWPQAGGLWNKGGYAEPYEPCWMWERYHFSVKAYEDQWQVEGTVDHYELWGPADLFMPCPELPPVIPLLLYFLLLSGGVKKI